MEPPHQFNPYTRKEEEEAVIGNPEMIYALKVSGQIGLFYNRAQTTKIPTLVEFNPTNFRSAAYYVLTSVLRQQIEKLDSLAQRPLILQVDSIANQLANGVAVTAYLKVRSVNYLDTRVSDRIRRKPRLLPAPFEVILPYAVAISQLGQIKVSGLPQEIYLSPGPPAAYDITYGCPIASPWIPAEYVHAVEQAKKLGLRFTTVDLSVKRGSSWWLYRPNNAVENFSLTLPYPEENFTENTAVLASLFAINPVGEFYNPIVDLDAFGNNNYGSMMRRPPLRIAVDTFYALAGDEGIEYANGRDSATLRR